MREAGSRQKSSLDYETIKKKIFEVAKTDQPFLGESIPLELARSWRVGQILFWHAEELLEALAFDLRRECARPWHVRNLTAMVQFYLRYPTVEKLASGCAGQGCNWVFRV